MWGSMSRTIGGHRLLVVGLFLALSLVGCNPFAASQPTATTAPGTAATGQSTGQPNGGGAGTPGASSRWRQVKSWLYQLQKLDIDKVAASKFDLLVTDYSADGSDGKRFTPEQVAKLKQGPNGPRLVLAYMSIGEAEDYRFYWQKGWGPGNPEWIHEENVQFKGNFPVEYWRPEWKKFILGSPDAYLDKIIDAGFDGVYLDIIEAYEIFEGGRPSARQDMVQFVREIADYAHKTKGKPDFGIFPQNGEPLEEVPGYLDSVTGIGREDIYYGNPADGKASPKNFTQELEKHLDKFVAAGKLVLTVDYTQSADQIADGYKRARARNYVHYATVRNLDQLVINRGFDPE